MVMGGLIQETKGNTSNGLPLLVAHPGARRPVRHAGTQEQPQRTRVLHHAAGASRPRSTCAASSKISATGWRRSTTRSPMSSSARPRRRTCLDRCRRKPRRRRQMAHFRQHHLHLKFCRQLTENKEYFIRPSPSGDKKTSPNHDKTMLLSCNGKFRQEKSPKPRLTLADPLVRLASRIAARPGIWAGWQQGMRSSSQRTDAQIFFRGNPDDLAMLG